MIYEFGDFELDARRRVLEQALELSPASVSTTAGIATVLILQGPPDEALKVIPRLPAGPRQDQLLSLAYFARGEMRESDATMAVAEVYAARKDADRAFQWLDVVRHRSRHEPGILPEWALREGLQITPYLTSLHADPRWGQLLAAVAEQAEHDRPRD